MKQKKLFVFVTILAVIWFGFIFYMSSQTAADSGQMSKSVTKGVVLTGEKAGVIQAGTVNSETALKKYHVIIRNLAHIGMYFLFACILFSSFWAFGINKKKSVLLSFAIGFFVSIIDEVNQMHFAGRNSGGVISDAIDDIYRDTFGICSALLIFVIIRVMIELRDKNRT